MILTVTLNPCIDKTIFVKENKLNDFIKGTGVKMIAGGKGNNVARVIKSFGHNVTSLTFLGDFEGKMVRRMIEQDKVTCEPVWIKGRTREIVTIVEEKTYKQTVYFEPSPQISSEECSLFVEKFERLADDAKIVIFSGSSPCRNADGIYEILINKAKQKGICTFLDSSREALKNGVKAGPFLTKPNLSEAMDLYGRKISGMQDKIDFLNYLSGKEIKVPILTLGNDGALFEFEKVIYEVIPPEINRVNPVGSGDSMIAGIAVGIFEGREPVEAVKLGIAAGTANAAVWDAACIRKDDVMDIVKKIKVKIIGEKF